MAHSKYGRDNIATITRRHGTRMNRVPRFAVLCLTALSAIHAALLANELRLHDKPVRNAKTVRCLLPGAAFFVLAGGSFSLELSLLAPALPGILPALNIQPKAPCGRDC